MYIAPSTLPVFFTLASLFFPTNAASASQSAIAGIKVNLLLSKLVPGSIDPFEPKGVLSISFGKLARTGNGASIGRRLSESCKFFFFLPDTGRLLKRVVEPGEAVAQQPVFAFTPIRGFPISQDDKFTIAMASN